MNLHGIANSVIGAVNSSIPVTLQLNTGYTTDTDGTRIPTYVYHLRVNAQIQALTYGDMQLLDGLVLQGERRAIYLNHNIDSISRPKNRGGDLVTFPQGFRWPYGTVWLIAQVIEQWPSWCKVVATLQNGS